MKRKKGYFSISAVAQMFSIHPQTIRLYEQEGLISPKRTDGNTRLFSEEDVNKLEEIVYLTHHLGINLAGVEMVLKLKKQIKKMQREMNSVFKEANSELSKQEMVTKAAIKASASRLMKIKQQSMDARTSSTQESAPSVDIDNWEIEYD